MQRSILPLAAHRLDHASHRGGPLTDGDVDADNIGVLLVDDRIDRDGCLAGGPFADDQLALAAPNGKQRVDDQKPGLDRFGHEIAFDDLRALAVRPVGVPRQRSDLASSSGRPSGSTTRPSSASPTGTLASLPVRRTFEPASILSL